MKRVGFTFAAVLLAVFAISHQNTNAVEQQFAEKFVVGGIVDTKGESGVYEFDKNHTFISFKVNHLGLIDVPGQFRDFTGTINYDAADVTKSSVNFTAKAASVNTGAEGRDAHLKRTDFFDAEKFPDITFVSKKVEKRGDDIYITGDFTLRGVTKSISFDFDINGFLPGNERSGMTMGVSADTEINRFDYGVDYGKNVPVGRAGIANRVEIDLQIEAKKTKPAVEAAPKAN
jgi:polyisoprenoid-binding protein YceI